MKPSTRKGFLFLLLGLVFVLLSFEFLATSGEFYLGHPKHSSTTRQILEYAGAVTVFIGVIMFAASSLTLAFGLHPKGTIKFGAILVLSFITSFIAARPYFGHSWTMFPVILSMLGFLFSMLIVVIGVERWRKLCERLKTNA